MRKRRGSPSSRLQFFSRFIHRIPQFLLIVLTISFILLSTILLSYYSSLPHPQRNEVFQQFAPERLQNNIMETAIVSMHVGYEYFWNPYFQTNKLKYCEKHNYLCILQLPKHLANIRDPHGDGAK